MKATPTLLLLLLCGTVPSSAATPDQTAPKAADSNNASEAAEPAPVPKLSAKEIQGHLDHILAARSYPEANPSFEALYAQEAAFPRLLELVDNPKLHPEVRFYLVESMLRMPFPAAIELAARFVQDQDQDLRARALRRLMADAGAKHRDVLMDATLAEKDDAIRADLLFALGRTDKEAIPFLEGYLKPGQHHLVLNGAARGLGQLGASASAVKVVPVVTEDLPAFAVNEILAAMHEMLGRPPLDRILALARDASSPLRLYGVNQLHDSGSGSEGQARIAELQAAALSAMDDPSAMLRSRAVRSFATLHESQCAFIPDAKAITNLLRLTRDNAALVRLAVIEGLHNTVLRRGLITPMAQPAALDGETMRMLRWSNDWLTFPALISLLDDSDPAVREKAAWELGISTGYWYGYADIRLQGTPQITPEMKAQYRTMWDEMKGQSPDEFVRTIIDTRVQAMQRGQSPALQPHWMRGIRLLTGKSFGWKVGGSPESKKQALDTLAAWWQANRALHPGQWIIDTLNESGLGVVDDGNLHVLGRWGQIPYDRDLFDPVTRKNDPKAIIRRINAWWETVKLQLGPSSSPSR